MRDRIFAVVFWVLSAFAVTVDGGGGCGLFGSQGLCALERRSVTDQQYTCGVDAIRWRRSK